MCMTVVRKIGIKREVACSFQPINGSADDEASAKWFLEQVFIFK